MWKELIVSRGVKNVSNELGVSRATVYNWLNGKAIGDNMKVKLINLFDGAFGIMDFFKKDENES